MKNTFFYQRVISFWFTRNFDLALEIQGEAKECRSNPEHLPEDCLLWLGLLLAASFPFSLSWVESMAPAVRCQ